MIVIVFLACLYCNMIISEGRQVSDDYTSTNQWPNRSTIVHLFEWKWVDIAEECEKFLAPHGFGGVQTSPASENLIHYDNDADKNRPWWERYQIVSYKLITRSGNEEDFKDMTKRCNKVGVRIYVDVTFNHMTALSKPAVGTAGSFFDPGNYNYTGVPYTVDDFHYPPCKMDFNDAVKVRICELDGLKDLNQSRLNVRVQVVEYLNKLIQYGVAGFRIDAAKHVWPQDLRIIYDKLQNLNTDHGFNEFSRPYIYQEIPSLNSNDVVKREEYSVIAPITEFKAGLELSRVFRGMNSLHWLTSWGPQWGLIESRKALVFIDNHDNQRSGDHHVLTYKEARPYKAAVAFLSAHTYGTNRIISSFDFQSRDVGPPKDDNDNIVSPIFNQEGACTNGWICEHRWREIYQMVAFRNIANESAITQWWDNDSNQVVFCRGGRALIAFNNDNFHLNQRMYACLPKGTYCDIVSGQLINNKCTGKMVSIDEDRYANILLKHDESNSFMAIHIGKESMLSNI